MFPSEREVVMDIESKFVVTKIVKNVKWHLSNIHGKENKKGGGGSHFAVSSRPPLIYKVTLIELEYIKEKEKLPLQGAIERMKIKESKSIPLLAEYKKSMVPHAEDSSDNETITCSTNSGRAIKFNLRTGEIIYIKLRDDFLKEREIEYVPEKTDLMVLGENRGSDDEDYEME